jgi:tRNA 5-methylaminomethyl-2-thiouridine biosynthesis bifunctional protein
VTQLAWDEKSQQKIDQMLSLELPDALAVGVDAEQVLQTTGETGCGGIQYPAGGCYVRHS